MKTDEVVNKVVTEIARNTRPVSIFLYGSYATNDYVPGVSDLEIGVLRKKKSDVPNKTLRAIAQKYSRKNSLTLRVYAYDLGGFDKGTVDSPFTKSVFIRHLILTSQTIWGKEIMEHLAPPPLTLLDAYREACFSTMRILAGLFFLRAGNMREAHEMSYKACLFGTLSLEYLNGDFPVGFGNIVKASKKLQLTPKERKLIKDAYLMRNKKKKFSEEKMYDYIFGVMTYCSQTVEARIRLRLKRGDRVLIP